MPGPLRLLPRAFGWMHRLLPVSAGTGAGALDGLSAEDPEMAALIADAPVQVGRILRPFCHLFGIKPPPALMLPKRMRVRKKKEPLPPHPAAARFPDTPAARSAARALARVQAGLPVDVKKLSAVAYGYFVHPPRDGNCPPPEIGYGGRTWRPPKDYKPPKDWD